MHLADLYIKISFNINFFSRIYRKKKQICKKSQRAISQPSRFRHQVYSKIGTLGTLSYRILNTTIP